MYISDFKTHICKNKLAVETAFNFKDNIRISTKPVSFILCNYDNIFLLITKELQDVLFQILKKIYRTIQN